MEDREGEVLVIRHYLWYRRCVQIMLMLYPMSHIRNLPYANNYRQVIFMACCWLGSVFPMVFSMYSVFKAARYYRMDAKSIPAF